MVKFTVEKSADFDKHMEDADSSLVVVHFSASWAPQCQQMEAVIEELDKDSELQDVTFLQVEAESLPDISQTYGVTAVPTFVLLRRKQKLETVNGANALQLGKVVRQHANAANGVTAIDLATTLTSLPSATEDLMARLKQLVSAAPCMLFMKGVPKEPKCGFSRQIIDILDGLNADYGSFDILCDEKVRQGLKEFSKWPTYPQLYIGGELVGGLDIVKELNESGELQAMIPKKQNLDDRLKTLISKANVMVFMKGEAKCPRCGFSKQLVAILNETRVPYETFDILEDEEVRQGLKILSKWPTYPQMYVKGNFIGGVDIIKELAETGELLSTLDPSSYSKNEK